MTSRSAWLLGLSAGDSVVIRHVGSAREAPRLRRVARVTKTLIVVDNNGIEFKFPRKTGKTKGTWSWTRLERVTDRVTEEIRAREARARLRSLLETISDKGAIKLDEVARQFASSGGEEEE